MLQKKKLFSFLNSNKPQQHLYSFHGRTPDEKVLMKVKKGSDN